MTRQELKTVINNNLDVVLPASGNLTDDQIDDAINNIVTTFNNLDPDRPVKVKQLTLK